MVIGELEKEILSQKYDGADVCPHCDTENIFSIDPLEGVQVKCSHCGQMIMPCSLCDKPNGCNLGSDIENCRKNIFQTLIDENMDDKF